MIKLLSMELISQIATELVDDETLEDREMLLMRLAHKCSPAEVLHELMARMQFCSCDEVFTSLLKVIQVALRRLPVKRARCAEWVYGSIMDYLNKIPLPEVLTKELDDKEYMLVENDESVMRFLKLYLHMLLFLEPLVAQLAASVQDGVFFDTKMTQKNVLFCFILRLMGKLLPMLPCRDPQKLKDRHLPQQEHTSTTYSWQVAKDMTKLATTLVKNPFFLLPYGEKFTGHDKLLKKWSKTEETGDDHEDATSEDYFMNGNEHMMDGLAILYYDLLGNGCSTFNVPLVYEARYVFEMGLHYVVRLVNLPYTVALLKGIRLARSLVEKVKSVPLSARELESPIHISFCGRFIRALELSRNNFNRDTGVRLLRMYIRVFDDEGRYTIFAHLLKHFDGDSVRSFAINEYRDLASAKMLLGHEAPLPLWYSGEVLREMLLSHICVLKEGVETDLVERSFTLTSALSALWVLLKTDQSNRSGVWDCFGDLEKQFLAKLRTALDLSTAHYKNELSAVNRGDRDEQTGDMSKVSISALNGEAPPIMTRENNIDFLNRMILTLEMLEFNLSRISNDIEQLRKARAV
ncbi:glomulin [Anopheles bellator]|uniref:glomulin n=1 Tax=Anopheles bellator TaxID=139047 RepID=UPI002647A8F0|nr:glomulin [Anopheles bellator]